MPKPDRFLLQLRLTGAERRRIKSLAAKQGLTLQKAVVVAFDAWAEKLRNGGSSRPRVQTRTPPALADDEFNEPLGRPSWDWLTRAVQLDWSKCPEVELVSDGTNQLWLLRETDAPLSEVLGAVADGNPVNEVAEIFEILPAQLKQVLDFAGGSQ